MSEMNEPRNYCEGMEEDDLPPAPKKYSREPNERPGGFVVSIPVEHVLDMIQGIPGGCKVRGAAYNLVSHAFEIALECSNAPASKIGMQLPHVMTTVEIRRVVGLDQIGLHQVMGVAYER